MKQRGLITSLVLMSAALAACSTGDNKPASNESNNTPTAKATATATAIPAVSKDPVELHFVLGTSLMGDIWKGFETEIKKKHPNYTFKTTNATEIPNLMLQNTKIDGIITSLPGYRGSILTTGLMADMSDVVKSNDFDLGRFQTTYLDMVRNFSGGKLAALPFYDVRHIMYYNKNLFDKFGIPYPKDGMTWDDTYEIARKMTKSDGGVQYLGFAWAFATLETNQASLAYLDPKTLTAKLNTDGWRNYLNVLERFYKIPGYNLNFADYSKILDDSWNKEQRSAMFISFSSNAKGFTTNGINWDVVTLPELSGLKGVGAQPYPVLASVTSNSAHRNEAFQAISVLLSDDMQKRNAAELTYVSTLKNPDVNAVFGRDAAEWKGKNIKAITSQRPAAMPEYLGALNAIGGNAIGKAIKNISLGEKDVNTALREAEEEANIAIETEKKK